MVTPPNRCVIPCILYVWMVDTVKKSLFGLEDWYPPCGCDSAPEEKEMLPKRNHMVFDEGDHLISNEVMHELLTHVRLKLLIFI